MVGRPRRIWVGAFTLWALVACFNRLGEPPVYTANEAREGVYVRAMLASGNFVAPMVANHLENGEVVPDKPPLFHWLSAAATWARALLSEGRWPDGGDLALRFDEWTLRFPSALAAVVMVAAVAGLGPSLVGERAAWIAAGVLLTSFQFSYQARLGRVDMTFACCVTLAVLLAGRAIVGGRPRSLPLAGVAAGLAVLAKGPLGIVLPALGGIGYLYWRRRDESASALPWKATLAALLAVALPWYVMANVATGGAILRSQLFAENLDQFAGGNGRMRLFFYLEPWLLDSFPWSLVALAALFEIWKRREPGPTFCAVVWLAMLAFFEVAAYKRRAYLLPALPIEALLAGWFLDVKLLAGRGPTFVAEPRLFARGLARATLVCGLAAIAGLALLSLTGKSRLAVAGLSPLDAALGLGGVAVVGLSLAALIRAVRLDDRGRALCAVFAALGSFYMAIYPAGLEMLATEVSAKSLITRVDAELPAGSSLRLCGIGEDRSLVVLLYFRDPERVMPVRDGSCRRNPPAGFYLLSAHDWRRVRREEEEGYHVWDERFGGQLKGSSPRSAVVFAERRLRNLP